MFTNGLALNKEIVVFSILIIAIKRTSENVSAI
jgi:hypothetical protein